MGEKEPFQTIVEQQFREFLQVNELRQTRERFAILRAAYEAEGTFTIENLQEKLQRENFRVSTSTLYVTTQLLVKANLLVRHPFSSQTTLYERVYDDRPRSYQVCNNCHRITLIKSRELAIAVQTYRPRRFNVTHRINYIYGVCPKCETVLRKKIKQIQNKIDT